MFIIPFNILKSAFIDAFSNLTMSYKNYKKLFFLVNFVIRSIPILISKLITFVKIRFPNAN